MVINPCMEIIKAKSLTILNTKVNEFIADKLKPRVSITKSTEQNQLIYVGTITYEGVRPLTEG